MNKIVLIIKNLDYSNLLDSLKKTQIQWFIIGVIITFAGDTLVLKRSEKREEKRKLLDKFSKILLDAKEDEWTNYPSVGEAEFQLMCSKLTKYSKSLGIMFKLDYYETWTFTSTYASIPYKTRTEEEEDLRKQGVKTLEALNFMFFDYCLGNKRYSWRLKHFAQRTIFKLKRLNPLRKKPDYHKDKRWKELVKMGKKAAKDLKKAKLIGPY